MEYKNYTLNLNSNVPFRNNTDYCIGTARMSLALRTEYQEQLKLVQDEIGFSYIRGHGLFCDDMGIYHEYTDNNGKVCVEYNFTYLDMVMDFYKEVHIKPFLELGLMPKELASGTQCIFYWEGKTTPPKDYDRWCDLIKATLNHLIKRYGRDEVITWPVEVWNEPNQTMFWENKDKDEYNTGIRTDILMEFATELDKKAQEWRKILIERAKIDENEISDNSKTLNEEINKLETAIRQLVEKIELLRKEQIKR